ncbi:hypothetical protein M434DRAFT_333182 [Hypoxylon sp. CO27-5]|nr:hypothetical protein M434DRAFT_333182 [Hypoxylon sp. CO27-5]
MPRPKKTEPARQPAAVAPAPAMVPMAIPPVSNQLPPQQQPIQQQPLAAGPVQPPRTIGIDEFIRVRDSVSQQTSSACFIIRNHIHTHYHHFISTLLQCIDHHHHYAYQEAMKLHTLHVCYQCSSMQVS